jgi:hypothetical protein
VAERAETSIDVASAQLEGFINKFDEPNQALIRSVRAALRRRLPTANELVYDNYNFFVIGYSPTERPSDCIVSIAANGKGTSLSFYRGNAISDPDGLLLGSGSQNRFIRLHAAADIAVPAADALIERAIALSPQLPPHASGGKLIIRSISAKQRPRRMA